MTIGELAAKARVNIQSVRFYERRRILRQPARTAAGYRIYSNNDLEDILFVKQCQESGFTLKEIQADGEFASGSSAADGGRSAASGGVS